jgi:hypothetical protein
MPSSWTADTGVFLKFIAYHFWIWKLSIRSIGCSMT